jgi:Spy/CpxP family protein refolding chaperone
MKRASTQITILLVALTGSLLQAQEQRPAHSPLVHSGSASADSQPLAESASGDGQAAAADPLQAIAQFLSLTPDQVAQVPQLLQARAAQLMPLLQAIAQSEQQLQQLLDACGSPSDVGQLVIQIHTLQQQAAKAQQQFLSQFVSLLTPEQRQRFEAVHLAASLQPIIPALQQLGLL